MAKNKEATGQRKSDSGSQWAGNWPKGFDSNGLLTRPKVWAKECAQMMTDPVISDLSHRTRSAMLQGEWTVVPGEEGDQEAEANAEFIREVLGLEGRPQRAESSWEQMLSRMGRWLEVGYAILEPVFTYAEGRVWLKDLYDLEPASIAEFIRDDNGLAYIKQDVSGSGRRFGHINLNAKDLLILTANQTGDVYVGQGLLRPCYYWWGLKNLVARAIEATSKKWSVPAIKVLIDRILLEGQALELATIDTLTSEALDLAAAYAAGDATVLKTHPGLDYQVMGQGAFDPVPLTTAIAAFDSQMAQAWSASYTQVGLSGQASRAVGEVHYDAWRTATTNRADYLASAFRKVIVRLLEFNQYGKGVPARVVPKLAHSGMEVDGLREALGTLSNLVSSGVLTPGPELERRVRRLIGVKPEVGSERAFNERPQSKALIAPSDGGSGRPKEDL